MKEREAREAESQSRSWPERHMMAAMERVIALADGDPALTGQPLDIIGWIARAPGPGPKLKINITATHPHQEVSMTSSVIIASMPPEPGADPILKCQLSREDVFQPLSPTTQEFTVSEQPAGGSASGRRVLHLRRAPGRCL